MEILARTNPRTVDMGSVGRGTTHGELTPNELAAILHSLSDGAYRMGMCFFANQCSEAKVSDCLYQQIKSGKIKIKKKRKHEEKKPVYSRMALLAVKEVVSGNKCPACRGTQYDNTGTRECCTCRGKGRLNPTDQWRSEYCYADDWDYWKPVYEMLYTTANNWLSDAKQQLTLECEELIFDKG